MSRFITQDVAGEALPQTHERRLRPPQAPKRGVDWFSLAWVATLVTAGAALYIWLLVWTAR